MQIEIDFEVFKALTSRRETESTTYNDVIRTLLKLPPAGVPSPSAEEASSISGAAGGLRFSNRGLKLPEGTELRATYKGNVYRAQIQGGRWIDQDGNEHSSPSAAASAITGNNVNGWRFWEARRPGETNWLKLDAIPKIALI